MMMRAICRLYRFAGHQLQHLARDRSATSGVEFALVLPILLILLAGTVDLGHALTVSRKMDQIAATTGDMISQQSTWASADVTKLLSGASFILQPYDLDDLTILVAVEDVDSGGNATVNWSAAYNTHPAVSSSLSPVAVPTEIQEKGTQMILTRVQYNLTTPVTTLFANLTGVDGYSFDRHFFSRPRTGNTIKYN
jgi:Flp pilus assembly protein TadG